MNKFDEGKIYKITDHEDREVYIGSTCASLTKRMEKHRGHYRAYLKGKSRYMMSFYLFDTYGLENCRIKLVENFCCNTKAELLLREAHHIKETNCVNKNIPFKNMSYREKRTENYFKNKQQIQAYKKEWYERTKENRKAHLQEYRNNHKKEASEYNKMYRETHKEQIKEYMKNYRQLKKQNQAKN